MLQTGEVYINPLTDFGFKRIFGTPMNKELLISFLNALFNGEQTVKDVTFQSNEHQGTNIQQRRAVFDVFCTTEKGDHIIVEMQNVYQQFYKDRSVYYSTFPIAEQAKKGDWNYELKNVYTVGILNFTFPEDEQDDRLLRVVKLTDVVTKEVFYDKLAYYYVELENFHKGIHELNTIFDKWLFALRNMQNLLSRPAELQERVFTRLFEQAEIAKFTPQELMEYEQSSNAYRDIKNGIDSAKKEGYQLGMAEGMEKGMAEGMEKGMAEGIEKGMAEGIEKGMAEGMEKGMAEGARKSALRTAAKLKAKGMSAEDIAEVTGLLAKDIDLL